MRPASQRRRVSAAPGTGIIAGGPIRAICEVVGIKDIVAKSLGTSNPMNVLRACIKALRNQNSPKLIAKIRGKKIAEITKAKQRKENNWGGFRIKSEDIAKNHYEWCKANGYYKLSKLWKPRERK